jgi:SSS family solute:Na+ symporter
MSTIIITVGIIIIIYTVLGGIEAVIWTEVVQAVLKTLGAILILLVIIAKMPGGVAQIVDIGQRDGKFSLGSLYPDFTTSTFWVVLLYGFFINLNNFGIDQTFVQRYLTTTSQKEASKSLWLCVKLYMPVSLLFLIIGTCLYAYYQVHPELTDVIRLQAAAERLPPGASQASIADLAATLKPVDYGDKVMPHFLVTSIPTGLVGLIIAAILSAAMSTISSGMNSSATVFTEDIYKRYFVKWASEKQTIRSLYAGTFVFGAVGIACGVAMIGVKSILDLWWELSGIFAAGMLGLFLLGISSRRTNNVEAFIATVIGILVIIWMTFPELIPDEHSALRNVLHKNMIIVIGTMTIFLVGLLLPKIKSLFKPVHP